MDSKFQMLVVGELLEEGITKYPEMGKIDFWGGGAGIYCLYVNNPTLEEKDEILKGKVTLGLMPVTFRSKEMGWEHKPVSELNTIDKIIEVFTLQGTIFILIKFGRIPWLEAPFNVNLCLDDIIKNNGLIIPEEGMGYTMQVVLVNAATGIVEGLRVFACPREFCKDFKEFVDIQIKITKNVGFDKKFYEDQIFDIYNKFSTDYLVKKCKLFYKV